MLQPNKSLQEEPMRTNVAELLQHAATNKDRIQVSK